MSVLNFIYKDKIYPIRRGLLKAHSKYFAKNEIQREYYPLIGEYDSLNNLSDEAINAFIEYFEQDTIDLNNNNIFPIKFLASKYGCTQITQKVNNYIKNNYKKIIDEIIFNDSNDSLNKDQEIILTTYLSEYFDDEHLISLPISNLYRILNNYSRKTSNQENDEINEDDYENPIEYKQKNTKNKPKKLKKKSPKTSKKIKRKAKKGKKNNRKIKEKNDEENESKIQKDDRDSEYDDENDTNSIDIEKDNSIINKEEEEDSEISKNSKSFEMSDDINSEVTDKEFKIDDDDNEKKFEQQIIDFIIKLIKKRGQEASILINSVSFSKYGIDYLIEKFAEEQDNIEIDFSFLCKQMIKYVSDRNHEIKEQAKLNLEQQNSMKNEYNRKISIMQDNFDYKIKSIESKFEKLQQDYEKLKTNIYPEISYLKKDMIDEIKKDYDDKIDKMKSNYDDKIDKMKSNYDDIIDKMKNDYKDKIDEIKNDVKDKIDITSNNCNDIIADLCEKQTLHQNEIATKMKEMNKMQDEYNNKINNEVQKELFNLFMIIQNSHIYKKLYKFLAFILKINLQQKNPIKIFDSIFIPNESSNLHEILLKPEQDSNLPDLFIYQKQDLDIFNHIGIHA